MRCKEVGLTAVDWPAAVVLHTRQPGLILLPAQYVRGPYFGGMVPVLEVQLKGA